MRWLLNFENPVMHYILKFFDCMCLSVLWLVSCLPVITVGASTTALYATVYHYIRKEEGNLLRTFLDAFRENWKRSTLLWLAALALLLLLAMDVLAFRAMAVKGEFLGRLYWLVLLLCAVALTWFCYLFAYAARFQGSVKDVLKFSLILMAVHPIRSLLVFLPAFCGILIAVSAPGLLPFVPAGACWIGSITVEKVFRLHLSPEDAAKQDAQKQK